MRRGPEEPFGTLAVPHGGGLQGTAANGSSSGGAWLTSPARAYGQQRLPTSVESGHTHFDQPLKAIKAFSLAFAYRLRRPAFVHLAVAIIVQGIARLRVLNALGLPMFVNAAIAVIVSFITGLGLGADAAHALGPLAADTGLLAQGAFADVFAARSDDLLVDLTVTIIVFAVTPLAGYSPAVTACIEELLVNLSIAVVVLPVARLCHRVDVPRARAPATVSAILLPETAVAHVRVSARPCLAIRTGAPFVYSTITIFIEHALADLGCGAYGADARTPSGGLAHPFTGRAFSFVAPARGDSADPARALFVDGAVAVLVRLTLAHLFGEIAAVPAAVDDAFVHAHVAVVVFVIAAFRGRRDLTFTVAPLAVIATGLGPRDACADGGPAGRHLSRCACAALIDLHVAIVVHAIARFRGRCAGRTAFTAVHFAGLPGLIPCVHGGFGRGGGAGRWRVCEPAVIGEGGSRHIELRIWRRAIQEGRAGCIGVGEGASVGAVGRRRVGKIDAAIEGHERFGDGGILR